MITYRVEDPTTGRGPVNNFDDVRYDVLDAWRDLPTVASDCKFRDFWNLPADFVCGAHQHTLREWFKDHILKLLADRNYVLRVYNTDDNYTYEGIKQTFFDPSKATIIREVKLNEVLVSRALGATCSLTNR